MSNELVSFVQRCSNSTVEEALLTYLNNYSWGTGKFVVGYAEDVYTDADQFEQSLHEDETGYYLMYGAIVREVLFNKENKGKVSEAFLLPREPLKFIAISQAATLSLSSIHEDIVDKVRTEQEVTYEDLETYNVYLDTDTFLFRSDRREVHYRTEHDDIVDFIVGKVDAHMDLENPYELSFEGFSKDVIMDVAEELGLTHCNPFALEELYDKASKYVLNVEKVYKDSYKLILSSKNSYPMNNYLGFVMDEEAGAQCLQYPEFKSTEVIDKGYGPKLIDITKDSMSNDGQNHWYHSERTDWDPWDAPYRGPLYFRPEDLQEVELFIRDNRLPDKINYDKFFIYCGEHNYLSGVEEFRDNYRRGTQEHSQCKSASEAENMLQVQLEDRGERIKIAMGKSLAIYMYAKFNGKQVKSRAESTERGSVHSTVYTNRSTLIVDQHGAMHTANPISEGSIDY